MPPRKRHAFTLIEILMVIIIIALLVSLVIPGLSLARQAMNSTYCLNNLQQLAKAMAGYGTEFKTFAGNARDLPSDPRWGGKDMRWITVTGGPALKDQTIAGVLFKYVESNAKVYLCPTFKGQTDIGGDRVICHYAIPTILSGMPPENLRDGYYQKSGGEIVKLPGVPIIVEPQVFLKNDGTILNSLGVYNQSSQAWTTLPDGAFEGGDKLDARRHNGKFHMAFANGAAGAFNFGVDEVAAEDLHMTLTNNNTPMDMGGTNAWEDWSRR